MAYNYYDNLELLTSQISTLSALSEKYKYAFLPNAYALLPWLSSPWEFYSPRKLEDRPTKIAEASGFITRGEESDWTSKPLSRSWGRELPGGKYLL